MSQIPLQLQSVLSVFKQENLDKLYFRTDEFKKIFLNLQKFLLENYGCFFQYGKLIQKSSSNLDEYLKNYLTDDKNCMFFAKYISNMFNSFGDDFSKIFYGLNEDLNSILNEIVDKIINTTEDELYFESNDYYASKRESVHLFEKKLMTN